MRIFCGDLQRGNGFQAGLHALLLSAVPDAGNEAFLLSGMMGGQLDLASDVLCSHLQPVDRSVSAAAATLALAALGARRRGRGDISAGGRRGV